MQKYILNVKLPNRPTIGEGKSEHNPNNSGSHHRAKSVKEINTHFLMKTFGHESRFVSFQGVICMSLNFLHPFTIDHFLEGEMEGSVIGGVEPEVKRGLEDNLAGEVRSSMEVGCSCC
jgi:hypothetical protein